MTCKKPTKPAKPVKPNPAPPAPSTFSEEESGGHGGKLP